MDSNNCQGNKKRISHVANHRFLKIESIEKKISQK